MTIVSNVCTCVHVLCMLDIGYYLEAALISPSASNCATTISRVVTIQGQRLIEEIGYKLQRLDC